MRHAAVVQQVRDLVAQIFTEMGEAATAAVEETILIRDGFYCGRRYTTDHGHAIWFCEENQIKFYGRDGKVKRVIPQVEFPLAQQESASRRLSDIADAA